MFEACAGGGVNSQSDNTAKNNVARSRGNASADDLSRHRDLLWKEPRFFECRDKFFVLVDRQGAWRYTPKSIACVNFRTARRRIESDALSRAAKHGRAAGTTNGKHQCEHFTHDNPPVAKGIIQQP